MMERRSNRSRAPELATRFYLLALTQRHPVERLVLADERGHLVAGVETRPFMGSGRVATRVNQRIGQELASVAPLVCGAAPEPPTPRLLARLVGRVRLLADRIRLRLMRRKAPAPLVATPFEAGERRFFVVAAGTTADVLNEAAAGLKRILERDEPDQLAA